MTTETLNPENIILLLEKQRAALNGMLEILQQEYQSLQENDLETFDNALEKKQTQLVSLQELEKQFQPIIDMMGGSINRTYMEQYIEKLQAGTEKSHMQAVWDQFLSALGACDEQNRINNRVLESSRINIRQALDILRSEVGTTRLYGASGKEDGDSQGNSLAIA